MLLKLFAIVGSFFGGEGPYFLGAVTMGQLGLASDTIGKGRS